MFVLMKPYHRKIWLSLRQKVSKRTGGKTAADTRADEPGREQLSQCRLEAPTGSPFQSYHKENCIVTGETGLKAGECAENITNNLKKKDALVSEI